MPLFPQSSPSPIPAPFLNRAPLRAALGAGVDATGLCSAAENWGACRVVGRCGQGRCGWERGAGVCDVHGLLQPTCAVGRAVDQLRPPASELPSGFQAPCSCRQTSSSSQRVFDLQFIDSICRSIFLKYFLSLMHTVRAPVMALASLVFLWNR